MKFKILTTILLLVFLRTHASAAPVISQQQTGIRMIHEILSGDSASIAPYFEDSVKSSLTKKTLQTIQSQISWLSKLIGDTLEQLTSGTTINPKGNEKVFFREYRLANESDKRAPLIVVHVWFKDSVTNQASGTFVKTFLENSAKRIVGEQTWNIGGKNILVSEVSLIEFKQGSMLAIKVFDDDDTTRLDTLLAQKKGVPIIRKAIAEGFLTKAKQELQGKKLLDDIGIAFIRKDRHYGYSQFKFGIAPRYYLESPGKTHPTGR